MGGTSGTHDMRNAYNILVRRPEERDSLEDLGVDGTMILK
jgi:hypothetical protein